ncbi:MAG: FAD-dependent oxidoreductase [Candidatus Woesearchaeota archaeon]
MQKFQTKVTNTTYLTEDTLFLSLTAPADFTFQAGQFITLMIKKDQETKPRSYSILNPPSKKGTIDLCIKIVKNGFASEVFAKCKKNDEFEARGPFGHFIFNEKSNSKENWFICTGTGIVPLYSMIQEHLTKSKMKFKLFWGLRYAKDIFFKEEFDKLKQKYPHFDYIISISREKYTHTGHVQEHLGKNFKDKTFYICGLKELVIETKELLEKAGVSKEKINFERYS